MARSHFLYSAVWSSDTRQVRMLAAYENQVALFYIERDAYVAALNRAKIAIETYHGADSGADSLRIMIICYEGLGMTGLAEDTRHRGGTPLPRCQ